MSSFGRVFRVTTFGESHCASVGVIIDGVPPRIPLTEADIQPQLDRRRPGQSTLTTPRSETDTVRILSGTENGVTLGTPICLMIPNKDTRPTDYLDSQSTSSAPSVVSPTLTTFIPRPSHADYTYLSKYGVSASSGGGRASARETAARVAAGAVAEIILRRLYGVEIVAYVSQVGTASLRADVISARKARATAAAAAAAPPAVASSTTAASGSATADENKGDDAEDNNDDCGWLGVDGWLDSDLSPAARAARAAAAAAAATAAEASAGASIAPAPAPAPAPALASSTPAAGQARELTRARVDASAVRCPRLATARAMEKEILAAAEAQDSIGGIVSCVIYGLPPGLGEPCFDKLEATLAHAMMSIPASKGFEIGSGFACARMRGSDHNDPFAPLSPPAAAATDAAAGPCEAEAAAAAAATGFPPVLRTTTNLSGGIQGGISNGMYINMSVAFKPPATIGLPQQTATLSGVPASLEARGRHDPCVAPRAVAVVEAMAALALVDAVMIQAGRGAAAAGDGFVGRACDFRRVT